MSISVFDLFSIGIGPSSSHTVGPMRCAKQFLERLEIPLGTVAAIHVELFGSLAFTGKGHGTDLAILLGLQGEEPARVDPEQVPMLIEIIRKNKKIALLGKHPISFDESMHLSFNCKTVNPFHSNSMEFVCLDSQGRIVAQELYYSLGGGFIISHKEMEKGQVTSGRKKAPYDFISMKELEAHCKKSRLRIHEIMWENEKTWRSEVDIRIGILHIWDVMKESMERGFIRDGILPGGLNVRRRAPSLYRKLLQSKSSKVIDPAEVIDWVSVYAIAVNEENAAGGRVVTAPTNGAAGVIPAVLRYYEAFTRAPSEEGVLQFLLVAAAIGILYKRGASLSAAEMGCQGEVGVACSMAAGGLAAAMGGTDAQIENAAEIGMEHNLGLTCDPVGGLVQIPCIERNSMGAIKAISAARLALKEDGVHKVSLDSVIATMKQTGRDMKTIYKETSQGGLAVNVPEC